MDPSSQLEELAHWLETQREEKHLSRIELAASMSGGGRVYEDTLILTDKDANLRFGNLPEARNAQVRALLRDRLGKRTKAENVQLFVVCRGDGSPPQVRWTDDQERYEGELEKARRAVFHDPLPYGRALAEEIASFLDTGGFLSICDSPDPREGRLFAFWRQQGGSYAYGERFIVGHEVFKEFPSRKELLSWLAARSDEDFTREGSPFSRVGILLQLTPRKS